MTPEQLWDNHSELILAEYISKRMMSRLDFLAALAEYGELVKAEAVKVCKDIQLGWSSDDHLECADAIEKMKLP